MRRLERGQILAKAAKGGVSPTAGSFSDYLTAMRQAEGEEKAALKGTQSAERARLKNLEQSKRLAGLSLLGAGISAASEPLTKLFKRKNNLDIFSIKR
jgi:hypothetical protein